MAPVDTRYYEALGVAPEASAAELSQAYRKMALKLHPDKGGSEEQFKAMKAAYDVLKDPQKRQMYNSYGPAVVSAMDGEVLEPEVMLEVVMSVSKTASRMVLFALPFVTVLLLFPAVALALKWDQRVSWDWSIVFIPMWIVQVISLLLLLKLRSVMTTDHADEDEDEADRAENQKKKRKVKQVFSMGICIMVLLIAQEALVAAKLQGYLSAAWLLIIVPYLVLEFLLFATRFHITGGDSSAALIMMLLTPFVWGLLRLCTVALLAAKADEHIAWPWTLCLIPLMIGATVKLMWACKPVRQTGNLPENDGEDVETPPSNNATGVCLAIGAWLSMLVLGAGKLDGSSYSAFLVFLPFFLISTIVLCCCGCLACCGPLLLQSAMQQEQEEQETARRFGGGTNQDYRTMPAQAPQSASEPLVMGP